MKSDFYVLRLLALSGLLTLIPFATESAIARTCLLDPLAAGTVRSDDSRSARTVEVPATIKAGQAADLYSKVGGFLKSINVDIGDKFSAGDVLAELNIPELETQVIQKAAMIKQAEAEVKQAKAAVREAEARLEGFRAAIVEAGALRKSKQARLEFELQDFRRLTEMAKSSSIRQDLVDSSQVKVEAARSDLDSINASVATAKANQIGGEAAIEIAKADLIAAQSHVIVAQANHKHAEQLLCYSTIKAPWDGVVLDRYVDAGAFIQNADGNSAARPMLRIGQIDKVRVTFALSNADIEGLDIGDRAVLSRIAALKDQQFPGKVKRFSAGLNQQTRMLKVEVELENPDGKLKPGFFGYVKLYLDE